MADTMISDLTDGLISYMISFLPTEDAVRTSVLAKRWRYFWTFLTVLDLKSRWSNILDFPDGVCFPLLTTLNLSRVTFANEDSAQQLFSLCPLLQELSLYKCCWANIQQITIAISTLRILTIVHKDRDYAPFTVKINAVNLISLSCTSYSIYPIVELLPSNLTSVVDAHIDLYIHIEEYAQYALYEAQCVVNLLRGLNTVKSLKLSNDTLEFLFAKDSLHLIPSFHNLTHLHVLSRQFDGASVILEDFLPKTPKLEVLQIQTGFNGKIWSLNSMPCCFKSTLKLVCISEYFGEIEFVRFLLDNATSLREIKIFWLTDITSDLNMLDDIKNQLQPSPSSNCVITFQ